MVELRALVDLLEVRARAQPDKRLYTFLENGEAEGATLTYGQLASRARALGAVLARQAAPGERALLLYPPGLDFVTAFLGAAHAGLVAVPAYPPTSKRSLPRLASVAGDARPALALTVAERRERFEGLASALPEMAGVAWVATDEIPDSEGESWRRPELSGDSLAFLQYTSGSTAEPKGVEVTHGSLLHNEELIRRAFGMDERSVVVGWLPLYHDMGLIGNVLQPLYAGASCHLMSPLAFLERPRRWLEAVSRLGATTSGGPNFAYELCVEKVPEAQRSGLDLGSWRVAFNGSEPVRAETLRRFAEAFAGQGFRAEAFLPCYGLAEATLFAAGGPPEAAPAEGRFDAAALERHEARPSADGTLLAASGRVAEGVRAVIVDPESRQPVEAPAEESAESSSESARVGEIWLAGESVAAGYWGRPEATAETFGARLASGEGPFLRTGDLGFLASGRLYVTGRIKDLIILRGRNHYPQDVERTVEESHPALQPGGAAAFSVEQGGEERLVVVQEVRRVHARSLEAASVVEAIRLAVAAGHEVEVHAVSLVRQGGVPKTSSGKVRRRAARQAFLDGTAPEIFRTPHSEGAAGRAPAVEPARAVGPETGGSDLAGILRRQAAAALRVEPGALAADRPLVFDSLAAVELRGRLAEELGIEIPLAELLEGPSLEQLAARCAAGEAVARPERQGAAEEDPWAGGPFPLSAGQHALWLLEGLAGETGAYNVSFAARVETPTEPERLRLAFQALVDRHASLRTVLESGGFESGGFESGDNGPRQRVLENQEVALERIDAAGWAPEELTRRLAAEAHRPFDLAAGPLFRLALFEGAGAPVLLFAVHHVAVDLTSLAILARDLGAQLGGESGGPAPAPEYRTFVAWQRALLAGDAGEALWRYWQVCLDGVPEVLELPADRPWPEARSFRGAAREIALGPAPSRRLRDLAARQGTTLFTALLALYQCLLARWCGQDDLLVAAPVAGRGRAGFEEVTGYLVNTVPLRAELGDDPTFLDLVARTREAVLGALEHQDLPFPVLVERLEPRRTAGRSPMVQALFSFQRPAGGNVDGLAAFALGTGGGRARLGTVELRSVAVPARAAQLELSLQAGELEDGLHLRLVYAADLFDSTTAVRLLAGYRRLLGALLDDPRQPVSRPSLLSAGERQQMVVEWNDRRESLAAGGLLPERIAARAARTPGAVAVADGTRELTYAQLVRRVHGLARRLRGLGLGPEDLVAVAVERSVELPVATLGVLAAGAAYLPLDPSYPRERLAFMLEDSGARVLVTDSATRGSLPGAPLETVLLDSGDGLPDEAEESGETALLPDNLAYVLYTSGSTGKPKGVMVSHRSLLSFLFSMGRQPGLGADGVLLAVTPLSFDISGLELYLPLLAGGRLEVARRQETADGAALLARIERCRATALQATPATWRLLLEAGWKGPLPARALCGGEALPSALAAALAARAGSAWNLYGPTETTIWSAVHRTRGSRGATAAIGRPIANTRLLVLDRRLGPVPAGVAGQLWIGGVGLARGYLRRPALSAARFAPDPFAAAPGERLYATGDLARCRPDGVLEFLGRLDHQLKVRGFRIEAGEVEAVLAACGQVRRAVVVACEVAAGDHRLAAYLVPAAGELDPAAVRAWAAERLPEHMVPSLWTVLEELPLTPNGKIDRRALPRPEGARAAGTPLVAPRGELEEAVAAVWCEVLGVPEVGVDDNFFDLGGHSLLLGRVHARLCRVLGRELPLVDLFRFPTVRSLVRQARGEAAADHRAQGAERAARRRQRTASRAEPVAIVGLAGRFPGAPGPRCLWRLLREGAEAIRTLDEEALLAAGVDPARIEDPAFVPAEGVLDGADLFDAGYFGYNPREAEVLDPQQRLFLECAAEALADAGCDPATYPGSVGVYAGAGLNSYLLHRVGGALGALDPAEAYQLMIGNDKDFLASRVSYKLGLAGPSVAVQTACSTSLVAVHLACQSLQAGECDMALAGGVSVATPQGAGYLFQPGMILSPDGHCRAFDAGGRGTVRGSGLGIVALKRLADAEADGDTVRALVRGSAVNNDGAEKVGYTAPSISRQAAVVAEALAVAGVEPESISYVEAHGTGTELGDPVEVAALTEAFATGRRSFCALGSVKTNLGHLDAAAGVTGLIKTVLALEHGEIPPSLHFAEPNPKIDFASTPFFVNDRLRPWPRGVEPRRAGVSSFGIGGTNAHVVLEEAPPRPAPVPASGDQLLCLAARSAAALERSAARLADRLEAGPEAEPGLHLANISFTLAVGRPRFEHRLVAVARDTADAARALRDPERLRLGVAPAGGERPAVFLFPGQGAQYPGMGAGLYAEEPVFRRHLDRSCELLREPLGIDLRELLCAPGAASADAAEGAARRLRQTRFAQPALFAVEHALARLWMEWGVAPAAMLGHSLGEWTAACLAGVVEPEAALALVAERGRLMQAMEPGAMIAVPRPWEEVEERLPSGWGLAAVNAPDTCVVSGPSSDAEELLGALGGPEGACRRLHTSHAFHSPMMEAAVEPFRRAVAAVPLRPPRIPFVSNSTGTWIRDEEATDPGYWASHLRRPVRFAGGLGALLAEGQSALLEVGPGHSLCDLARRHPDFGRRPAVASLRHARETVADRPRLLDALGRLWLAGVEPAWPAVHGHEARRRVPLPAYPFERQRFRLGKAAAATPERLDARAPLGKWLYAPSWRGAPPARLAGAARPTRGWLVLADSLGLAERMLPALAARGGSVALARPGEGFSTEGPGAFRLDPASESHWESLAEAVGISRTGDGRPFGILHLWNAGPEGPAPLGDAASAGVLNLGFYSLLHLARALFRAAPGAEVELEVAASQVASVLDEDPLCPEKAALLGPCRVLPHENPRLSCRLIDLPLDPGEGGSPTPAALDRSAVCLAAELEGRAGETFVAYRGGRRWLHGLERLEVSEAPDAVPRVREGRTYLITGGLGGIGLTLARHLAGSGARLVLVSRSALPERTGWSALLDDPASPPEALARVRAVLDCEAAGAEVVVAAADVADPRAMEEVLQRAEDRFGPIGGVIHAAGVEGAGLAISKDRAAARAVLRPKVEGARVLDRLLEGRRPDFVLLCSSITAQLGGPGQLDYCAANAFLDALAWARRERGFVSLAWDTWKEVGMAARAEVPAELAALRQRTLERAIAPAEGVEVLGRALGTGLAHLVVSVTAFEGRAAELAAVTALPSIPAEVHARPELSSPYAAPGTEHERLVAAVWQELLGVDRVGLHDNFFELGGHSLLGVRVISEVSRRCGVEIPAVALYEGATVKSLAAAVAERCGEGGDGTEALDRSQERGRQRRERARKRRKGRSTVGAEA